MIFLSAREAGPGFHGKKDGFTLIELLIVMTIIGILATLAVPSFRTATLKAREAVLKRDLFVFRDAIDQFRADQGKYPDSLRELVDREYLRAIPADPFTKSAGTWVEIPASDGDQGGVFDVHSGSDLVGTNDIPYNQW
jgi:general secretion pathway protein G